MVTHFLPSRNPSILQLRLVEKLFALSHPVQFVRPVIITLERNRWGSSSSVLTVAGRRIVAENIGKWTRIMQSFVRAFGRSTRTNTIFEVAGECTSLSYQVCLVHSCWTWKFDISTTKVLKRTRRLSHLPIGICFGTRVVSLRWTPNDRGDMRASCSPIRSP